MKVMSAAAIPRLTLEQYLVLDREAERKSEFYDGVMYAMAGGTYAHSTIMTNTMLTLGSALKGGPCRVRNSELRVRAGDLHTYPDVSVICGPPELDGDTLLNPVLIVEVLSPSTESDDRGFRFSQYRKIASLREYVLIAQREPRVEVFRRQPTGRWEMQEFTQLDQMVRFESLNCEVPMSGIYEDVEFTGAALQSPLP